MKPVKKETGTSRIPPRAVDGFKEKTLSRRRHQDGQLLELEHGWAVRFREDYLNANGARCRRRVQKMLGSFEDLPSKRAAQNAMEQELASVNNFTVQPRSTTLCFRQAASRWIADCEKRKRKPIKPGVILAWRGILRNHILDLIGDTPLSEVQNRTMKSLVERLDKKGLSPATIKNIMLVVKLVVASLRDDDGNHIFPVKWNTSFIDAPAIDPEKQPRPKFTSAEVEQIVQATTGRMQMAAILFAASGMRAGELLGLEIRHFDGASVKVEQEVWVGRVQEPKTRNARRTIDLHPDVSSLLRQFIGDRSKGFLFQTESGKPMGQRNLSRELYSTLDSLGISKRGFHAFRRYRNTFLRNSRCPDGLLKFWIGHADKDLSDTYDRSREDLQFRKDVARSMGVGFELPKTLSFKRPKAGELGVIGHHEKAVEAVSL